jgi:endonuclease G
MASKNFLDNLTPGQRVAAAAVILVIAGVVALVRWRQEPAPAPQPPGDGQTLANRNVPVRHARRGESRPRQQDAYLIDRPQYVLSYNDSKKIANWACWNLSHADIGKTARGAFAEDPDLPPGFRRVTHGVYTGSGFDRGHLCPSKDRSDTEENNDATFLMTNVIPQSPACNRGAWERFESHCRDLTKDGSELYIACGPHGVGGTGEKGPLDALGRAVKVSVPAAVWKVVLVLPGKDARPGANSKMFAIWCRTTRP